MLYHVIQFEGSVTPSIKSYSKRKDFLEAL